MYQYQSSYQKFYQLMQSCKKFIYRLSYDLIPNKKNLIPDFQQKKIKVIYILLLKLAK